MQKDARQFKDDIYEQIARIGKAVSAAKRIEILDFLCQGPCSVELLANRVDVTVANASKHLQVLRAARLVEAKKIGLHVEYRIADAGVSRFFHSFRSVAEARIAEIGKLMHSFLEERDALEEVDAKELLRRVKSGEAVLIDVRPEEEFQAGHLPGAISLPLSRLKERLKDLPKRREIIAYCRGPYCVMAIDAVTYLKKRGYSAHHLDTGVLDWQVSGKKIGSAQMEAKQ
jgi:rhodanese-related sulfurtransferase